MSLAAMDEEDQDCTPSSLEICVDGEREDGPESTLERMSYRSSRKSTTSFAEQHHPRLARLVKSELFETMMGVMILMNCVTMGIGAETHLGRADGWKGFVSVCEVVFTLCFLFELSLRVFVHGWRRFIPIIGDTFDFLDAMVVLLTAMLLVLALFEGADSNTVRTVSVLRVGRLMRLVRVVAKVKMFHEVWQLMRGAAESMRTLFWTIVVTCFITYIFAVFGVVLISSRLKALVDASDGVVEPDLEMLMELFNGIFCTMQTLVQVLLLDSVHSILHPLMKYVGWSWVYFYAYISMAVIVLLNLVTAIIVDNAMKNSQKDEQHALAEKENNKKRHLAQFRSLFQLMDVDGDGQLTWQEFESAFEVPEVATKLKMLDFEPDSCKELFHLLDHGDGSLSLDEFFEGISNMAGPAQAKDSFKLLKVTSVLQRSLQQLANDIQEDHHQLLHHTPGCAVLPREGSLRSRSRNNADDSSVVSSPARAESRRAANELPVLLRAASGNISPTKAAFCDPECSVGVDATVSPALGSLRKLPGCLTMPPVPEMTAVERECSVGHEGDMSPALGGNLSPAKARRRQLGTPLELDLEGTSDSSEALKRVNEVSDQVAFCNLKVDTLAASMSRLESSLALVLQKLGSPPVQS